MTRVLAVVALLLLGMLAPVAQARADENPPTISNLIVSPSSLPSGGGTVTVTADVVDDDSGVGTVYAETYTPDGIYISDVLVPIGGSTYQGTLDIPSNGTESEQSYAINVGATDNAWNYSEPAFAGEVSVAAEPPQDPFPWVSNTTVTPRNLPSGGGAVTIDSIATDNRSVNEVYAQITGPNGFAEAVEMLGEGNSHFVGTFNAPANPTASARQYTVTVYASDDIGQQDSDDGGTITVAGTAGGTLNAHLVGTAFGQVQVGRQAFRQIKVRNTGKAGTPPVTATATLTGSPAYSIVGPSSFRVKPGESRYFVVRFAPTAPGQAKATVSVNGLEVRLTGRGVSS